MQTLSLQECRQVSGGALFELDPWSMDYGSMFGGFFDNFGMEMVEFGEKSAKGKASVGSQKDALALISEIKRYAGAEASIKCTITYTSATDDYTVMCTVDVKAHVGGK